MSSYIDDRRILAPPGAGALHALSAQIGHTASLEIGRIAAGAPTVSRPDLTTPRTMAPTDERVSLHWTEAGEEADE